MVEGKGIGIGIGIVIGILVGIIASPLVDISMANQLNPIADIIETDDARLADLEASYSYQNDRLNVALILTNKDAEYTKANGHLELTVKTDGRQVWNDEYDFTKDDFLSWKTNSGEKITGYLIHINKYFPSGSYDVYVDFTTKSGSTWKDLYASFYSLN